MKAMTDHGVLQQQCLNVSSQICNRPGAVMITALAIIIGFTIFFVRRVILRTKPNYLRQLMVEEFQRLREIQFQMEQAVLAKMGVTQKEQPKPLKV